MQGLAGPEGLSRDSPALGGVLPAWLDAAGQHRGRPPRIVPVGTDSLTGRELDILGRLPTPLPQRELAKALSVSPNIARSIYGGSTKSDA